MTPPSPLNARSVDGMWVVHCGEVIVGWNDTLEDLAWTIHCPGTAFCDQLLEVDGVVVVPNDGGSNGVSELIAFAPATGAVAWRAELDFRPREQCAAVLGDAVFLYASGPGHGGRIVDVDAGSGTTRGATPIAEEVKWLASAGDRLIVGGRGALNVGRPGEATMSRHPSTNNRMLTQEGGQLYFVSQESDDAAGFDVCWWDGPEAAERGRMRFPGKRPDTAIIPTGTPGIVAVEQSDGQGLTAVDLSSGERLWTALADRPWYVRSGVTTPHGLAVALEDDDMATRIALLDVRTGQELAAPTAEGGADLMWWFDDRLVVGSSLMVEAFAWQA
ncbi:PQQ-binding-like beta-propeller repeat protein [Haliangium sp.]|uniref:outer membrane protein assembly factor BamB family protein n=1 Tax=Haliangium sp. TaxID=2663208 RepID=UPI003D110A0A